MFRTIACPVLLIALTFMQTDQANAQHISFRAYNGEQGLTDDAITSLTQDRAGFLYVGTPSGLYRYDGWRFKRLGPDEGLTQTSLTEAVRAAPDGSVWIVFADRVYRLLAGTMASAPLELEPGDDYEQNAATLGNDLLLVRNGRLLRVHAEPGETGSLSVRPYITVPDLAHSAASLSATGFDTVQVLDGEVWVGCAHHLCRIDKTGVTEIGGASGLPDDRWTALLRDTSSTLWARSPGRIASRRRGDRRFSVISVPGGPGTYTHDARLIDLVEDPAGRIVTQSAHGLLVHEHGTWRERNFERGASLGQVDTMLLDRKGSIWLGSYGHGLERLTGFDMFENWTQEQGLSENVTWNATRDGGGALWVANTLGIDRLPEQPARPVEDGDPASHCPGRTYALATSVGGHLWIGHQDGRLIRREPVSGRTETVSDLGYIQMLAADPGGPIWIGTRDGLARIDSPDEPGRPMIVHVPEVAGTVFAMTFDADGDLWVLTARTLFHCDHARQWHTVLQIPPAGGYTTHSLAFAPDRTLWLGSFVSGITRLHLEHGMVVAQDHLLNLLLPSQVIGSLLQDKAGRMWIGTERGLDVIGGGEQQHFDVQDGLLGNDIDENTAFLDRDGTLWFGTSGSVSHLIADDRVFRRMRLHPAITDITLGDKASGSYRLRPDARHFKWTGEPLIISFTALDFMYDQSIRFRYRLRGVDRDWVEATGREARYTNPPSGRLLFEVMAYEPLHRFRSDPVLVLIKMHPPWWKTWTAYGLTLVLVLFLLVVLWRVRIGYLMVRQHQLEQLVAERTREIDEARAVLFKQATYDSLTGLLNRRAIMEHLEQMVAGSVSAGTPLAVALLDLDHFKAINDRFGHQGGDAALAEIGRRLTSGTRSSDRAGRYGGEEMLVLLPGLLPDAPERADALRRSLFEYPVMFGDVAIVVRGSMGVSWMRPDDDAAALVGRADLALYEAKRRGRDQAVLDL